jgi:hypothetical protein
VCSSRESADHTRKNEKVVIPMYQEARQDILQMHDMVPNYITWFLREQSFCIIPSCCCTFNLLADDSILREEYCQSGSTFALSSEP